MAEDERSDNRVKPFFGGRIRGKIEDSMEFDEEKNKFEDKIDLEEILFFIINDQNLQKMRRNLEEIKDENDRNLFYNLCGAFGTGALGVVGLGFLFYFGNEGFSSPYLAAVSALCGIGFTIYSTRATVNYVTGEEIVKESREEIVKRTREQIPNDKIWEEILPELRMFSWIYR